MKAQTSQYRVVAACDCSPLGDRAVAEALRLCVGHAAAALHVITVGVEGPSGILLPGPEVRLLSNEDAQELTRSHVARIVDTLVAAGSAPALDKVAVYVTTGIPSERIVSLAKAVDADLIVLGTHGRQGLGRMLLGSVAEEVVRRAPCGVFVIRPRDFLDGERLPEVEPALKPGEHALLPFRTVPTFHYVARASREPSRLMPAI
jgi:nucleotide-binding universal stress UspA family protein